MAKKNLTDPSLESIECSYMPFIRRNGGSQISWSLNDDKHFKIEASKSTPQFGFRKRLKLFGDERYQAAKDKLKINLLERGCIDMLSWKDLT